MSIPLIQSLYNPNALLLKDEIDYVQGLKQIEYFEVSSQVYFLLNQQDKISKTPEFFQRSLKEKYNESLYLNIFIHNQTTKIFQTFESASIDVIPLKGTVFAEKYFGHIGARATSDIDLLIHQKDLKKAIESIKTLGFTIQQEPIPSHFHCSISKELPESPIPLTIELHWDILKENTAQFNIEEFWEKAIPYKLFKHVKQLSDYHTFYMICLHGWRHNLDSLKYFIDIIQLIHQLYSQIDLTTLLQEAAAHKTLKRLVRTLSIVYHQFPFLNDIKEFPQKRNIVFWELDAFLKVNKKGLKLYVDFIDYQFFSYDQWKHGFIEFYNWILPSKTHSKV